MKKKKYRIFACDFETTVDEETEEQNRTEVWASAFSELYTDNEDVTILGNIHETFQYFARMKGNIRLYYHNLKFDGSFWIDYLMRNGFNQAFVNGEFKNDKDMFNGEFKYLISEQGLWYTITIKTHNKLIEIRDSLKLIPFSLKVIGESFGTKHKKLEMEYKGKRFANCYINEKEKRYIKNDVLVLREALEIMFNDGHTRMTIGSCCMVEFKNSLTFGEEEYNYLFPDLTVKACPDYIGDYSIGDYIRKSYKGGWCYVAKGMEGKILKNGGTYDVNSLYPSMMHSESGNVYPVGYPVFYKGYIPDIGFESNKYFFVRVKTRFYKKTGYLPFIQIKHTISYKGNECLETSDIKIDNKYYKWFIDSDGNKIDTRREFVFTKTDYLLFLEHYNVEDFEILDCCVFNTTIGIFDKYIDKYKEIKLTKKGAEKTEAKLFMNNLYGKFATSEDSSFKLAYMDKNENIKFETIKRSDKKAGYIAVGSAITSYSRNFTIRAAQKNYYEGKEYGFIYADTDSIHVAGLDKIHVDGINIHDKNFCCWKNESKWDKAIFARQKTYIEHITEKDSVLLEEAKYDVKCAGMPDNCKRLFVTSMTGITENKKYTQKEKEFIEVKRTLSDFRVGLRVPSKLRAKRIFGGILLTDSYYEMR